MFVYYLFIHFYLSVVYFTTLLATRMLSNDTWLQVAAGRCCKTFLFGMKENSVSSSGRFCGERVAAQMCLKITVTSASEFDFAFYFYFYQHITNIQEVRSMQPADDDGHTADIFFCRSFHFFLSMLLCVFFLHHATRFSRRNTKTDTY
jgi:hypothetical protein